jgi:hypothetical protein
MPRKLEYFLLQYAPNALTDQCVNVGLVVLDPSSETDCFVARFAADWENRVRSIDPDPDLEVLAATWLEFDRMFRNPEQGAELVRTMEDSFCNLVRISSRRDFFYEDVTLQIDDLIALYLDRQP